ncbi:hypothetical protein EZS27_026781 [termite gut metagenome]|uniref:Uncharacterized protein n=1 Tax=termite gut metagenome TaxID=433724 RepID=A0A5J4QRQ3_9ZZZZ
MAKALETNDAFKAAIAAEIGKIAPGLITLQVKGLITGIELIKTNDGATFGVDFYQIPSENTHKFGGTLPGAIAFNVDEVAEDAIASVVVRVTPATAELAIGDLAVVNSKGEEAAYVKINEVKKYNGSITRATTATGLYEVVFGLSKDVDGTKLAEIAKAEAGYTAFALTAAKDEVRNVLTGFDITFEVKTNFDDPSFLAVYDEKENGGSNPDFFGNGKAFIFTVAGKPVNDLNSGLTTADMIWPSSGPYTAIAGNTGVLSGLDRQAKPNLPVQFDTPFDIVLDKGLSNAYAYYVNIVPVLGATTTESDAYKKISGLKVYRVGETASITIPSANVLEEKTLVFEVNAVNYDGTLVDPDGKTFRVIIDTAAPGTTLNFVSDIKSADDADGFSTTEVAIPFLTSANSSKVKSYELSIPVEGTTIESSEDITLGSGFISTKIEITAPTPSNVSKILFKGILPKNLKEDVPYTGTLTLRGANQLALAIYTVKLTKILPTGAPSTGLGLNNGTTAGDNIADGSYTIADKANGKIVLVPGITGIEDNEPLNKVSYTYQYGSLFEDGYTLSVSGAGITDIVKNKEVTGVYLNQDYYKAGTFTAKYEYNYGKILFGGKEEHKVDLTSKLKSVRIASLLEGYDPTVSFTAVGAFSTTSDLTLALKLVLKENAVNGKDSWTTGTVGLLQADYANYIDLTASKAYVRLNTGPATTKDVDLVLAGYNSDEQLLIKIPQEALAGLEAPAISSDPAVTRSYGLSITLVDKLGGTLEIIKTAVLKLSYDIDPVVAVVTFDPEDI